MAEGRRTAVEGQLRPTVKRRLYRPSQWYRTRTAVVRESHPELGTQVSL